MRKNKYEIPIYWECYRTFNVEANTLQEAVAKAVKDFLTIPDDDYLSDSFGVDQEILVEEYPLEEYDETKALKALYEKSSFRE